jgi:elongation factor Ts
LEKILNGKLNKFLSENSLEEQGFIKDPDVKIKDLCKKNDLKITSFSRIEVGKGIEKNEIDFADEVNSMIGK